MITPMFSIDAQSITNQMITTALDWNRHGWRVNRWVVSRGMASLGVAGASLGNAVQTTGLTAYNTGMALYLCFGPSLKPTRFKWLLRPCLRPQTSESKQALNKAWRHLGRTSTHLVVAVTALTLGAIAPSELFLRTIKKMGLADHLELENNLSIRIKTAARVHGPKIAIGLVAVAAFTVGYRNYAAIAVDKPELAETLFKIYALMTICLGIAGTSMYQLYTQRQQGISAMQPQTNIEARARTMPVYPAAPTLISPTQPALQEAATERPRATLERVLKDLESTLNAIRPSTAHLLFHHALNQLNTSKGCVLMLQKSGQQALPSEATIIKNAEIRLNTVLQTFKLTKQELQKEMVIKAKLQSGEPLHIPQNFTFMQDKSDLLCILEILCKRIALIRSTSSPEEQRDQIQAVELLWHLASNYQKQLSGYLEFKGIFEAYRQNYKSYIETYCGLLPPPS